MASPLPSHLLLMRTEETPQSEHLHSHVRHAWSKLRQHSAGQRGRFAVRQHNFLGVQPHTSHLFWYCITVWPAFLQIILPHFFGFCGVLPCSHSYRFCSGDFGRMDSDLCNATAFSMGVKKSKNLLPWEQLPLKENFGYRSPLTLYAQWLPESEIAVESNQLEKTVSKVQLMGKTSWTARTIITPWPVFEEAKLSKVLELWRVVILGSYHHTALVRQIHAFMFTREQSEEALDEVIKDALCGKSISTLRSRVASIAIFGCWKRSVSLPGEVSIFLITEYLAYRYICELRRGGAPRSRATRFLESVGFCKAMLVAEVKEVLASARVERACISRWPGLEPRKKDPLTMEQVAFLELLASTKNGHVGNVAGYMRFLIFGKFRWSDGRYCREEPWIGGGHDFSYLEARLYHCKTAGRAKVCKRLLPVTCPVLGVT